MKRGITILGLFGLLMAGCVAGPTPFPQQDASLNMQPGSESTLGGADAATDHCYAEHQVDGLDQSACDPTAPHVSDVVGGADGADAGDGGPADGESADGETTGEDAGPQSADGI